MVPGGPGTGGESSYFNRGLPWNQKTPTGVAEAQHTGLDGHGVKVAILDSGAAPGLGPLAGKDFNFLSYTADPNIGVSEAANDDYGHGSTIAMILAGKQTSDYVGGVAPGVDLYVSQICGSGGACILTGQQITDRLDDGVRLFNLSLGAPLPSAGSYRDDDMDNIDGQFSAGVSAGALFVFATGNHQATIGGTVMFPGEANVISDLAWAPNAKPDLKKGWLAVTNVDINGDGSVAGLDPTAVACGATAQWCLAAPGLIQTLPVGAFSTGLSLGTSNSTPIVTGTAALVWQVYPWMNNSNVQQTILTTATHLGGGPSNAPNATFGWGLVNAAKAIHGPAQFTSTFTTDLSGTPAGANYVFSNAVSGIGGLTVTAGNTTSGVLTLSASNSYTGSTTVKDGGQLNITGSIASNVSVNDGALIGTGTIFGDVEATGTGGVYSMPLDAFTNSDPYKANVGAGPGLTISGSYTASASGETAVVAGRPLTVGGTATLAGKLMVYSPGDHYTPSGSVTVLNAGAITGDFASYATGSYFENITLASKTATQVSVKLTVTPSVDASSFSRSAGGAAHAMGAAFKSADTWAGSDYAGHKVFLDSMAKFVQASSHAQVQASLASIGGQAYGTTLAIEGAQSRYVDHVVALQQNRSTGHGARAGFWVHGFGANGGIEQGGYASARYSSDGQMFGVDFPVTGDFSFGLLAGNNHLSSSMDGLAGHVDARNTVMGGYGKLALAGHAYLAARATWVRADLNVQRAIDLGGSLIPVSGSRTDGIGQASMEFGKHVGSFTPYVAVSQLYLHTGSFAERGGNGFGLSGQGAHHLVTSGALGVRLSRSFASVMGQSRISAHASWQHVFGPARTGFTAVLNGAPGATFTATGQSLAPDLARIGMTLDNRVNRHWQWALNLEAQGAPHRTHGFSAHAGMTYTF